MTRSETRRLRIFIAHPSPLFTDHLPHGDGLVSYGFIRRLAERGHELHVAAERVALKGPLPAGLHVYPLTATPSEHDTPLDRVAFMVRMRWLFERLKRRFDFDVVHQMNPVVTGLSLSLLGDRTPLVLGTFVAAWEHGADSVTPPPAAAAGRFAGIRTGIARLQQSRAAALLVASAHARSRICDAGHSNPRVFEVPHGIDIGRFSEREQIPERPSVLFLAGLAPRKGIFTLLDAFTSVASAVPGAELVIAGGVGTELETVRQAVAAMTCPGIRVLGAVKPDEVQTIMRAHSVYCLPSYGEPYGMSVLEAMACGLPIVATRAGGIPDLVTEEGARLVPMRDPAALAAALVEVLRSRTLQAQMGRHNRRRVETHFDAELAVDRLEQVYQSVVAGTTARQPSRGRLPVQVQTAPDTGAATPDLQAARRSAGSRLW